jgi:Zn-dependent protease
MRSSYRLGRFFDIDVSVHITFFLLPALMAFQSYGRTGSVLAAALNVLLVLIVFGFVVMHEYGHALTARRFGIRTRGITLYPIGGVAMLESMPKKPWHQILVAIAGPAVNFALAAGIATAMHVLGFDVLRQAFDPAAGLGSLLAALFWVNMLMGLFNLIPALPMDGGRILNAALSLRMPPVRATRIASRVAKVMALGLFAFALSEHGTFWHALIGMFVWSASNAEVRAAEHRARVDVDGEGHTQVIGRTPWERMAGGRPMWRPGGGPIPPRAPGAPGEVVEVVEGPHGPEVRIFRPR